MLGKLEAAGQSPADAWEALDIPDFLRLSPEERKAAWARNPPKSLWSGKGTKRPFHIPKGVEPEGLKLFEEEEREKALKKTERLAALKALPKKPRTKRRSLRANAPVKPAGRGPAKRKRKSDAARNHKPAVRARARSPKGH